MFSLNHLRFDRSCFNQQYIVATHFYTRLEMGVDQWTHNSFIMVRKRKIIVFCIIMCSKYDWPNIFILSSKVNLWAYDRYSLKWFCNKKIYSENYKQLLCPIVYYQFKKLLDKFNNNFHSLIIHVTLVVSLVIIYVASSQNLKVHIYYCFV